MFRSSLFWLPVLILAVSGWGAPARRTGEPRPSPSAVTGTGVGTQGAAEASARASAWSDADSPVPVTSDDPMWGHRVAPVTMVMFSDLQCPFCARVEPTLEELKRIYGPAKLRIIWKNGPLPFHPQAKPAAEAAMAVFDLAGS